MSVLGLRLPVVSQTHIPTISLGCSRVSSRRLVSRSVHYRKSLPYELEEGLGDFLPPAALQTVAVDFQQGLLDRLNDEVRGTPFQNQSVAQTVLSAAPHRKHALAFNYASQALNNSFFLEQLRPPPPPPEEDHEDEVSDRLMGGIRMSYLTIKQFKSQFSAAALGLSSSGWMWLVTDQNGVLSIFPTHGPGTLLIRSRSQMGSDQGSILIGQRLTPEGSVLPEDIRETEDLEDMDPEDRPQQTSASNPTSSPIPPGVSPTSPTSGLSSSSSPPPPQQLLPRFYHSSLRLSNEFNMRANSIYDKGPYGYSSNMPSPNKVSQMNSQRTLFPLFCVSMHEHAWMSAGYGVWGKEEWLKKLWTVLDWSKISKTYSSVARFGGVSED